ncbi:MAG: hypothetical protein M0009_10530 [Deltaproteobacteria bacterium]|nr:hypothetical protein [Deltaproteobacteria bacterium]
MTDLATFHGQGNLIDGFLHFLKSRLTNGTRRFRTFFLLLVVDENVPVGIQVGGQQFVIVEQKDFDVLGIEKIEDSAHRLLKGDKLDIHQPLDMPHALFGQFKFLEVGDLGFRHLFLHKFKTVHLRQTILGDFLRQLIPLEKNGNFYIHLLNAVAIPEHHAEFAGFKGIDHLGAELLADDGNVLTGDSTQALSGDVILDLAQLPL